MALDEDPATGAIAVSARAFTLFNYPYTVGNYWPYATTVFDHVRRAMPYDTPGILSDDEVYAITAFLLHLNGIVGRDEELGADNLADVVMPNRHGFVEAYSPP